MRSVFFVFAFFIQENSWSTFMKKNSNLKSALELIDKYHENVKHEISHWLENELFSWNWWILLAFSFIPWLTWAKVNERHRRLEIIFVGTLTIIPTTFLDAIGVDLKFWIYPVQFIPIAPRALPFDMSMIPVAYMLMFQYFNKWKQYILALVVMALLFAFIGEPLSKAMNLVYYIKWKYFYSFIYYLVLGLTIKLIVNKCRELYINE